MFFSKSCEYALRSILYLASKQSEKKTGIKIIAEELGIPSHFLGKIMQSLVKHNIVSSTKGKNGGFHLTEEELDLPLINVIHVIEGDDVFNKCGLGLKSCSNQHPCPIHNDIVNLRDKLKKILSERSIREYGTKINEENFLLFR